MKQVIGIYCGPLVGYVWDEKRILEQGGGGSETWAVEIAKEFQKRGFHVIVFGEPESWCFSPSGVEYLPYEMFEWRCQYQHFDYFISSRQINELSSNLSCNNVYIMSHDICLHNANTYEDLKMDRVKKIAYLSEWHKEILQKWYGDKLTSEQMFKTINGVDNSYYEKYKNIPKKNMMVWSSRSERCLNYFIEWVFPLIKKRIPDFSLKVCLYLNDVKKENTDGIEYLGKIGKEELAMLQCESKIWIYPNLGFLDTTGAPFQETFCITAVENGLAKNAILTANLGGLKTTLSNYSGLIDGELINNSCISGGDNLLRYAELLANKAYDILSDNEKQSQMGEESYNICKEYTWENAVNTWLKEWKLKY